MKIAAQCVIVLNVDIYEIYFSVYNFLLVPHFQTFKLRIVRKNWNWSFDVTKQFVCDVINNWRKKKKDNINGSEQRKQKIYTSLLFVCHSDQLKSRFCKNAQQVVIITITTTISTVNRNKKKYSKIFNILNQVCKRFNYLNIFYICCWELNWCELSWVKSWEWSDK